MGNYALLKGGGKEPDPVRPKRGYMSTVSEYLLSAELYSRSRKYRPDPARKRGHPFF